MAPHGPARPQLAWSQVTTLPITQPWPVHTEQCPHQQPPNHPLFRLQGGARCGAQCPAEAGRPLQRPPHGVQARARAQHPPLLRRPGQGKSIFLTPPPLPFAPPSLLGSCSQGPWRSPGAFSSRGRPWGDAISRCQALAGACPALQESGPLESEAMVLGVLNQAFDVLVLRYGVHKRIYCNVSAGPPGHVRYLLGGQRPATGCRSSWTVR